MKNTLKLITLLILVLTQSCNKNKCEGIYCMSPPSPFQFELVDKLTGENLFTNGTYDPNDIKVIDLSNNSNVAFNFINENDYNIISITSIGWETETINYSIDISQESIFEMYVNAERLNENCCSFTNFNEIRIENSEYQFDLQSGIYTILTE